MTQPREKGAAAVEQLDHADLHTETFSNSRGWTAVRVTHTPSSITVERSRGGAVQSAVQAQRECIEELGRLLAGGSGSDDEGVAAIQPEPSGRSVSRSEFEALAARVAALERRTGLGG